MSITSMRHFTAGEQPFCKRAMGVEGVKHEVVRRGEYYNLPEAKEERTSYRQEYPTTFVVAECVDGRVCLTVQSRRPGGLFHSLSAPGGDCKPEDPAFQKAFLGLTQKARRADSEIGVLTSYHFAGGDDKRGCRAYDCNPQHAKQGAARMQLQFQKTFAWANVTPIVVGVETDNDELWWHGFNGKPVSSREPDKAMHMLRPLFRTEQAWRDLRSWIDGNILHMAEVEETGLTPDQTDHHEQGIVIARPEAMGWAAMLNEWLTISTFTSDRELDQMVKLSGSVLEENRATKRVEGPLSLIVSLLPGEEAEATRLLQRARQILEPSLPDLECLAMTVDTETWGAKFLT